MPKSKLEKAREEARLLQEKRQATRISNLKSPAKRKATSKPTPLDENRKRAKSSATSVTKSHVRRKRKSLAELAMEQAKKNKKMKNSTQEGKVISDNKPIVDVPVTPSNRQKQTKKAKSSTKTAHKSSVRENPKRHVAKRNKGFSSTFYTPKEKSSNVKLRTSGKKRSIKPIYYSDVESENDETPSKIQPVTKGDDFCSNLKKAVTCSIALYVFGLVCLFLLDYMSQLVPLNNMGSRLGIDAPTNFDFLQLQPQDIILPLFEIGHGEEESEENEYLSMLQNVQDLPVQSLVKSSIETLVKDLDLEATQILFWKDKFDRLSEKSKEDILNHRIKDLAEKVQELNRSIENMQSKAIAYLVVAVLGGWVLGPIFL